MLAAVKKSPVLAGWMILFSGFAIGAINQQAMWLMAIAGIGVLLNRKLAVFQQPDIRVFLALWACWFLPAVISCFDSGAVERSLTAIIRYLSYGIAGFAFLALALKAFEIDRLLVFAGGLICFLALDGIAQFYLGFSVFGERVYDDVRYGPRVTGSVGIDYGPVMVVLSPFVFEMIRRHASQYRWLWSALPLISVAVVLSGSRASTLLFAVGLILFCGMTLRAGDRDTTLRFLLVGALSVVAIGVVVLSGAGANQWSDALSIIGGDAATVENALAFRPIIWAEAVAQFLSHPVNGVGIKAFQVVSQDVLFAVEGLPEKPQGWMPHLAILEIAVDTGVIGLFGYVVFIVLLFKSFCGTDARMIAPFIAVLLSVFPLASTLSVFSMRIAGLTWGLLGLLFVMARGYEVPSSRELGTSNAGERAMGAAN